MSLLRPIASRSKYGQCPVDNLQPAAGSFANVESLGSSQGGFGVLAAIEEAVDEFFAVHDAHSVSASSKSIRSSKSFLLNSEAAAMFFTACR